MDKPFPIDHDLHCHSFVSSCSADPLQSPQAILDAAKRHGFTCQCITDHFWDRDVPGSMSWYEPQDLDHVKQSLPLPKDDSVRMVFGCETEFCGGKTLAISPKHYDEFEFIIIPPNHFHMLGFVRPESYNNEDLIAQLLVERLEEIGEPDLPWRKVGIAHMTCPVTFRGGDLARIFRTVDERRYRAAVRKFAERGAGIEINAACFANGWQEHTEDHLRLYRLAKEEGCKFYLGSDAHHPAGLETITERLGLVTSMLGLTAADQYTIP